MSADEQIVIVLPDPLAECMRRHPAGKGRRS